MTKGILLSAFGRKGYLYAAYNMLVSIKRFNPNLHVSLAFDRDLLKYMQPDKIGRFDDLIEIPKEQFYTTRIDPAKYKTAIWRYLPYDETLILDVDALVLKDLTPFIDYLSAKEGNIFTDVFGFGGKYDEIKYSIWASNAYIWETFGLSDDAVLPSIQSSFMYVKKDALEVLKKVEENYSLIDINQIVKWGGTIPDELVYSGTFAQFGIIPKIDFEPIFFGNYYARESYTELSEKYYILSLYGNGVGRRETKQRYIDWYDKLIRIYCSDMGLVHDYKSGYILGDKHLNFR